MLFLFHLMWLNEAHSCGDTINSIPRRKVKRRNWIPLPCVTNETLIGTDTKFQWTAFHDCLLFMLWYFLLIHFLDLTFLLEMCPEIKQLYKKWRPIMQSNFWLWNPCNLLLCKGKVYQMSSNLKENSQNMLIFFTFSSLCYIH